MAVIQKLFIIQHSQDVHYTFVKPNSCIWQETQLLTEHDSICFLAFDLYNRWHLGATLYISICVCSGLTECVHVIVFTWFLTAAVFSSVGRWNATGKAPAVRILTTLPWTLAVLVRRLTLLRGRSPRLPMRWPSRPRAALHTCGVRTQTHTWHRSPCLDSRERSALRCDAGQCGRPTSLVIRPKDE